MVDVLDAMRAWSASGAKFAVASVIETWRSAPRPAGSIMGIRQDGLFAGSVSGGCVEAAVVQAAQRVIASDRPEEARFGPVGAEALWEIGLTCGGHIRVWIEPGWPDDLLAAAAVAIRNRTPAAVVSYLDSDRPFAEHRNVPGDSDAQQPTIGSVADRPAWINPTPIPIRLIIVGAVHIAVALVPLAQAAQMEVVLIDPRESLLGEARFPVMPDRIVPAWPQETLRELRIDQRTAIAVLSHDAKIDEPALAEALASPALYVGALGSASTLEDRLNRLANCGLRPGQLGHLKSPIGLPIGAASAHEIAVSILAEIIQVKNANR